MQSGQSSWRLALSEQETAWRARLENSGGPLKCDHVSEADTPPRGELEQALD